MSRTSRSVLSISGLLMIALLIGACGAVPRPQNAYGDGLALLQDLMARKSKIRSFRMAGTMDHVGKQRMQATVYVFAVLPDRIRMDLVSPFGHTLSVFSANQGIFGWSDYQNSRFYSGEASPCNVARFTGLALPPEALSGILIGDPPILDGPVALDWHRNGYYVATIPGTPSSQIIHAAHGETPELRRSIYLQDDQVLLDIRWDRWRTVSGIRVPEEVDIRLPQENERIWIRYEPDGIELNISFPENAFVQTVPGHQKPEILTCP